MPPDVRRAGLARSILIFFVGLGAAGLVIGVLNGPFELFVETSRSVTDSQQAAQGRQWIVAFWDALPFIAVFLAFLGLLGSAAAERRPG